MTPRQFRRLKARYRTAGVRGLVHRLRNRPSPRALQVEIRDRVVELIQTTYRDFNDCHCTEKLREVEGLPVGRETVRRLRPALGLPPKRRRRPPQHRARRPRHAAMGALVLIDGSPFDWLGHRHAPAPPRRDRRRHQHHPRAPPPPRRGLHGYLTLLQRLAERHGLPVTLYGDRLGVFVRNDAHWSLEEELQGAQHPTQYGQVLRDLGIGYIAAHSPQAKGRVERLWATLQDRLVAELHLHAIHTVDAAEAYLPTYLADHNRRFAHAPAEPVAAWRRPPRDLAEWLSCRYTRMVARDNTVRLSPRWVQIPSRSPRSVLCPVPRRRARMSRWPAARSTIRGTALSPPPPPRAISSSSPVGRATRLQSASEAGGRYLPLHQNRTSSALAALTALARIYAVRHAHIPGGEPSRVANANASVRRPSPPDGRTFSLSSYADISTGQRLHPKPHANRTRQRDGNATCWLPALLILLPPGACGARPPSEALAGAHPSRGRRQCQAWPAARGRGSVRPWTGAGKRIEIGRPGTRLADHGTVLKSSGWSVES